MRQAIPAEMILPQPGCWMGSDSSTAGDATVGNDADGSGAASSDDNVDGSQDQAGNSSTTISDGI